MSTVPTNPTPRSATASHPIELPDGRVVLSPSPLRQEDGYREITIGDPHDRGARADITISDDDTVWHCWYPDHEDEKVSAEREAVIARVCLRAALLTLELNGANLTPGEA